ncbi:c-type cytochrome [Shewanella surugensis]|uniref:Cytochrome c n=1 Tax=Shewanella surugensis TaxID=212020 RepID=A0ABT0LJ41_9GAMM|nr:cytochrome c [Shewanella surugensis]MCL1127685.1 cytochrome c [Shewanella surugensis]
MLNLKYWAKRRRVAGYGLDLLVLLILLMTVNLGVEAIELACQSCHINAQETERIYQQSDIKHNYDLECSACHHHLVNDKPIPGLPAYIANSVAGGLKVKKTYLNAKKLMFSAPTLDGQSVAKYTRSGLAAFLTSPVARFPFAAHNGMYPLTAAEITQVLKENEVDLAILHDKEPHNKVFDKKVRNNTPLNQFASIDVGEILFSQHCQSCHHSTGQGPLLRIGMPLLSFNYVQQALRYNLPQLVSKMPDFSFLSAQEVKQVYVYMSQSAADLTQLILPKTTYQFERPAHIYTKVLVPLFSSACRHCHTSSIAEQTPLKVLFSSDNMDFYLGKTKQGFEPLGQSMALILPTKLSIALLQDLTQAHVKGAADTLAKHSTAGLSSELSQEADFYQCQDSALLSRLKARQQEWQGRYYQDEYSQNQYRQDQDNQAEYMQKQPPYRANERKVKGMPLTLAPVDQQVISKIELWQVAGCPIRGQLACEPCQGRQINERY